MASSHGKLSLSWLTGHDSIETFAECCGTHSALPDSIFTSAEWFRSAAETAVDKRRPLWLADTSGSVPKLFLAFTWGRETIRGLPLRTIRLMGYPYGDRHPLGLTSESPVTDALKSAVTRIPVPYDVLIVDELLGEDANVLAAIAGQVGMRVRERASSRAPLYPISGIATPDGRFENYSRSLKQRVRRAKRKLEKEIGQSEIQISFATSENAASLIQEIAEIEKRSWKGRDGVGIFSDANAFSFFNRTVSELARHRRVVVSRLFADKSLVAYRLSFVAGNVLYDYNFAHLPDFSRFSPGRILLDELIGFSVREGFCALDGSRGYLDAPQLLSDWTATNVYQKTLWICRATPMGLIAYFASRLRTEIKALAGRS